MHRYTYIYGYIFMRNNTLFARRVSVQRVLRYALERSFSAPEKVRLLDALLEGVVGTPVLREELADEGVRLGVRPELVRPPGVELLPFGFGVIGIGVCTDGAAVRDECFVTGERGITGRYAVRG